MWQKDISFKSTTSLTTCSDIINWPAGGDIGVRMGMELEEPPTERVRDGRESISIALTICSTMSGSAPLPAVVGRSATQIRWMTEVAKTMLSKVLVAAASKHKVKKGTN